jgi:hypothetical protein
MFTRLRNALAFVLLTIAVPAFAQNSAPNLDPVSQDPEKPFQAERKASAAADASRKAGADVTFEQILQSPDDVELNERYALTQIRKGELRGAATTLERVLMVDPTRYRTRLLYGVVLVRLDDIPDAAKELDAVLAVPGLPAAVRDEAADYKRLTASRSRDLHFDARLTLGVGYDDNRNAAPDGDIRLVGGLPILLDPQSRRKDDANLQFIGSLGATRDIGGPGGHSLFVRFTYYRAEQQVYDLLNLQVYSPKIGATVHTRWADVTPTLSYDHVLLSQSAYLRSRNAGLRVSRHWNRQWESWFEFGHSYQDFVNTPRVPNATDRTGDQLDWTLGSAWSPTPTDRFTLTGLHRRKYALLVADSAYRRESFGGEWLHLLGNGRFLVMSMTGQFDRYEVPDATVIDGTIRHDDAVIGQLMYGQPLDLVWSRLKDFTGSVGYEYFMEHSNIPNFDYSNNKLTALVTYKWGI